MKLIESALFVVDQTIAGVELVFDLGWEFVTYSAGPLPIGAVAFVVLAVYIVTYWVDPPMYV